jgi:tRNA/rRNA methyltransferase
MSETTQTPSVILVQPQLGENIGAAARVMANFGLSDLIIVDPRDGWPNPKAVPMSAGSPVLKNATLAPDLSTAIAPFTRMYATTARTRDMVKPVMTARQAIADMRAAIKMGEKVAILYGAEQSGLPNEAVVASDVIITLPVDRSFSSLNLAQAVSVTAYEWNAMEDAPENFEVIEDIAPREDLIRMFEHLEDELHTAGYFHPENKTSVMIQNLRNGFIRGRWTIQEVRTFRGAIKALAKGRGKARATKS